VTGDEGEGNERTSLLPPSGISTNEREAISQRGEGRKKRSSRSRAKPMYDAGLTQRGHQHQSSRRRSESDALLDPNRAKVSDHQWI
jgi:hypothetical protein